MGIMEMMKKARENSREADESEWVLPDQKGVILIHSVTFFENDSGKWGAFKGEIISSEPRVGGAMVQKPGTKIKCVWKCHGDYPQLGYKKLYGAIRAIFDPADDAELNQALVACFGSDESGLTKRASKADRENPFFGARGIMVKFSTKTYLSDERKAKGLHGFTDESFFHMDQTPEEIAANAAKLPEVE